MYNAIIFTDKTDNITSTLPLGSYKCAHSLRKHGYSCLVINNLSDYTYDDFKQLIDVAVDEHTHLVGFSTTFLQSIEIDRNPGEPTPPYLPLKDSVLLPQGKEIENKLFHLLKSKSPNIKTVVGGGQVSLSYSNTNVDYICTGFSEVSIVNLMDHLTKSTKLNQSYRHVLGRTIIDDRYAKSYNFPAEDMQWQATDIVNYKMLPIEIGRGCIFKCKFCAFPMNGKQVLDFVKHADILYNELKYNYEKFGITHYMIVDDTFNDHNEKLRSIQSVVKRLNFQPIFWAYVRLDLICTRPETLDILYDIGLRAMYFGIETLNLKTGRIIGKGFDRNKQIEMMHRIRDRYPDVSIHGSFIVGLPEESKDSVELTSQQLIDGTIPLHSWRFTPLYIKEVDIINFNSDISLDYQKYGYEKVGILPGTDALRWKSQHMTVEEAAEMANRFNSQGRALDHFKISALDSMEISNFGLDFNQLNQTAWKNIPWHDLEFQHRPEFVKNYKEQLMDLILKEKTARACHI